MRLVVVLASDDRWGDDRQVNAVEETAIAQHSCPASSNKHFRSDSPLQNESWSPAEKNEQVNGGHRPLRKGRSESEKKKYIYLYIHSRIRPVEASNNNDWGSMLFLLFAIATATANAHSHHFTGKWEKILYVSLLNKLYFIISRTRFLYIYF